MSRSLFRWVTARTKVIETPDESVRAPQPNLRLAYAAAAFFAAFSLALTSAQAWQASKVDWANSGISW